MNVWIFQTGEPLHIDEGNPRPMRAMNLANTLIQYGHRVTIWSSNYYHQEKSHRVHDAEGRCVRLNDYLQIRLIPSVGYNKNIGLARLIDHAVLSLNLKKELSNTTSVPDVGFVGYPPIEFSLSAVDWLKSNNVPIMIDVKDQWPHVFVDAFPKAVKPLAKIMFYPYYYLGRTALRKSTAFSTMSQGFLDWMSDFSGRPLTQLDHVSPLSPISETYSDDDIGNSITWWKEKGVVDGRKRFFFVGSLSQAFDFKAIAHAASIAEGKKRDWQFVICGEGDRSAQIKRLFSGLSNVVFPSWVDKQNVIALSKISTLGLAPYKNTDNFTANIPNKIIDYLSMGKPIVSPLHGEVNKLINDEGVGVMYHEYDGQHLYAVLDCLCGNSLLINEMSSRAVSLYDNCFSGEKVYQELVQKLVELANYNAHKIKY